MARSVLPYARLLLRFSAQATSGRGSTMGGPLFVAVARPIAV
jgi:hypothetical protein